MALLKKDIDSIPAPGKRVGAPYKKGDGGGLYLHPTAAWAFAPSHMPSGFGNTRQFRAISPQPWRDHPTTASVCRCDFRHHRPLRWSRAPPRMPSDFENTEQFRAISPGFGRDHPTAATACRSGAGSRRLRSSSRYRTSPIRLARCGLKLKSRSVLNERSYRLKDMLVRGVENPVLKRHLV
jgi:hypothetical protein